MKLVPMPMLKTLLLNRVMSSIGDEERSSHLTNATRKTTKPIKLRMIGGEVHPMRVPLDTASRKVSRTAVDSAAPP